MPGPDPQAVWIEEGWDGRLSVSWEVFLVTNRRERKRRALAMLRNVARGRGVAATVDDVALRRPRHLDPLRASRPVRCGYFDSAGGLPASP